MAGGHGLARLLIVSIALAVASCGAEAPAGRVREATCGDDVRFPESFLEGPDQSRERFAATALGRVIDDFFMAGPGVGQNDTYREAEGFSPLSDDVALGYRDGTPTSFFIVRDGRVADWGACVPRLVESDL